MSDTKDRQIAELERKLADECNTALKTKIHDQRRELARLNERVAELERERDALAAALSEARGYIHFQTLSDWTDMTDEERSEGMYNKQIEARNKLAELADPQAILGARLAAERNAEQDRCIRIVRNEEELDGDPPEEISRDFRSIDAAVLHLRAVVRATKRSIIARIERGEVE